MAQRVVALSWKTLWQELEGMIWRLLDANIGAWQYDRPAAGRLMPWSIELSDSRSIEFYDRRKRGVFKPLGGEVTVIDVYTFELK